MRGSIDIQGGGATTFAALGGEPADNAGLAAALSARLATAGGTVEGTLVCGGDGAAATPALHVDGAVFTGGSGTTTKPQVLVEPEGTTSTGWSTAGTMLGVNAAAGFGGVMLEAQVASEPVFSVDAAGRVRCGNGGAPLQLRGMYGNYTFVQFGNGSLSGSHGVTFPHVGVGDVAYRTGFVSAAAGGLEQERVIEQRNDMIAQRLAIFNHHVSSTDREFVELGFSPGSDVAHLWTAKGSAGGAARELHLGYDGTASLKLGAGGSVDLSGLALASESISPTSTFQIKIGGTLVKVPCVVA